MSDTGKMVLCVVVGLLAGMALGFVGGKSTVSEPAKQEAVAHAPKGQGAQASDDDDTTQNDDAGAGEATAAALKACSKELMEIKSRLAQANTDSEDQGDIIEGLEDKLVKTGAAARHGIPMDWPEGMTPELNRQKLQDWLEELKASCPDIIKGDVKIECDEFPCIAMSYNPMDIRKEHKNLRESCPMLTKVYETKGAVTSMDLQGHEEGDDRLWVFQPNPSGTDQDVIEYLEEHQQNRFKRFGRRGWKEASQRYANTKLMPKCNDGDEQACTQAGNALWWGGHKEDGYEIISGSCERGRGGACNSMAWLRCKEERKCDEESLKYAQMAVDKAPEDGKGALDTMGYILCEMGRSAEANTAFKRSCDAGYERNCNRVCKR